MSNAVIAGGRDYVFGQDEVDWLDQLLTDIKFKCVVSGTARGTDTCGEMPADWNGLGMGAGRVRNIQMAEIADYVFLFPGGKGTAHMKKTALEYGLAIHIYSR